MRTSITFILFTFLSIFQYNTLANDSLYNIKDLEILEKQKSYSEFLAHAKDIRPSQRNSYWKTMVRNMGTGLVKKKIETKQINKETFNQIELLSNWSVLKSDEFFQLKRSEYAMTFFKECFFLSKASSCKKDISRFWVKSSKTTELAMSIIKLLQSKLTNKQISSSSLWPYYKTLTTSNFANFYCKDKNIKEGLYKFLNQEINIDTQSSQVEKIIKENIHKECQKSFYPSLKAKLTSSNKIEQVLSYKILFASSLLSNLESDSFFLTYILNGPIKGDLFNYAWKSVEQLGKNYKRRINALSLLKTLDPLPGKVFATPQKDLKKAIYKLLNDNFHEYIDHYALTCINYLKGNGSFPFGNPTMECDELFASQTQNKYVDDTLKIKFSSLKK